MFPYFIDVALTAWISSAIVNRYDYNGIAQYQNRRKKIMLLGLILFVWVMLFAFRGKTGSDTGGYYSGYKNIYDNSLSLDFLFNYYRDKLYQVVAWILSNTFRGSWFWGSFFVGVIIYFPVLYVIGKKSIDVNFSCLIYLSTLAAFFCFNGLRQGLSIAFTFMAYYCGLREKKIIRYALFMAIAYGFHAAALLIIPFHLISLKKLKSISTIILLLVAFVMSFFLINVWGDVIGFFKGDNLVSDYKDVFVNAHGSSIIRALFWAIPSIVAIFNYSRVKKHFSDIDHDIIMGIFGVVFMIYSMQSVSFSQMAPYFTITSVIMFPKIVFSFDSERRKNIKVLTIIVCLGYMLFLLWNGDLGINPYIPMWESGAY